MLSRILRIGSLWLVVGCGSGGTETGNPAFATPEVKRLSDDTFLLVHAEAGTCDLESENGESKLQQARSELEAKLGSDAAEFIVVLKESISLDAYPLPSGRDSGEDDPAFLERARAVAQSQACTLEALEDVGGSYAYSFVLINAFVAELTVEQAVALSELSSVQSVELAQTDEPPPF